MMENWLFLVKRKCLLNNDNISSISGNVIGVGNDASSIVNKSSFTN
jgi:hypothetical protein